MSNPQPRVSIGLPVYNGGRFLEQTLQTLVAQSYPDYELIISDNASTDDTETICRRYVAQDSRIRYYRNELNIGAHPNYNRVFELSRGKYFKWAAADDVCEPTYLESCVEVLDRDPTVVLAYPKSRFIDENGKVLDLHDPGWNLLSESAQERLRYVIFAGHWMNVIFGVMRAKALSKTRLLSSYPGADYRLLGELSVIGKIFEIPEYLFSRRLHSGASSQNSANLQWMAKVFQAGTGHVCLPTWRLSLDHLITIARSGLTIKQKTSLTFSLLRCMRWARCRLLEELKVAVRMYVGGSST